MIRIPCQPDHKDEPARRAAGLLLTGSDHASATYANVGKADMLAG
jgi:hypothetical protein